MKSLVKVNSNGTVVILDKLENGDIRFVGFANGVEVHNVRLSTSTILELIKFFIKTL